MESNLPAEFAPLLQLLGEQPENVRELFYFAIVLMMIDDEKARVLETFEKEERTFWLVETIGGDRFAVVRPVISAEREQVMMARVRELVAEFMEED